ncbi:MAG: O-antigen polymerase [candidate division WWE3 bacterium GW2011_GWA1_46_21]|uniref:O-antigen polymerase n=3 Tax=Katanobacteria TaxID=422282 RepID=A0A0G1PFV4_UNCKA|nr:MAG: O-antigen polymerase [candidate division WWE3 bacterium GW2011_GWA1_46_21]KKU50827.1 MAG: O-antigen polymerase [candidate division WWE3 bacterium GW2011_GWC1_47_10]KKU57678.1 MAG: O-antigen polymerase [candidate division WWE3 bacterium GW2011_GWB1_47_11]
MGSKASNLVRGLLYFLVFVTPLVFTTYTYESFEFPKMILVYIVGATVVCAWIVDGRDGAWRDGAAISLTVKAFLLAYTISTIFSMHFYTSLWGYYTRFNGGLLSILIFIGIYAATKKLAADAKINGAFITNLLKLAALTIIPIGIYALWSTKTATRVYSTFGQPNWLAAYISMLIPISLYFLFSTKQKLWAAIYLVAFPALWFAYSLSGLLGLAAGLAAFVYLNFNLIKIKANAAMLAFLIIYSVSVALAFPGIFKGKVGDAIIDATKLISTVTYAAQKSYSVSDPGAIRDGLWEGTVKLITASPKNFLIGTGPETFAYAFPPFRPPKLNFTSEWEFVFNKPHNYYLEIFANLGLLGLIPYLLILAKTIKAKDKIATPALIALYVTNGFGWPTVATSLLFWILLAKSETVQ